MPDRIQIIGVVTKPDVNVGRHQVVTPSPVKALALEHNLRVFTPEKWRENWELRDALIALKPDYIITIAYGKILPQWCLDIPSRLAVNIHGSLLPKYRGASPVQSALLHGEKETGITIMEMVAEMDAGAMLHKAPFPISSVDTTASVFAKMAEMAPSALLDALDGFESGALQLIPQNLDEVTFCSMIEKSDGLLDLSLSAQSLYHRWQAYTPWPWVWVMWEWKKLEIEPLSFQLEVVSVKEAGSVIQASNGIGIVCWEGTLVLRRVKPEGKGWMSIDDFVRGRVGFVGSKVIGK